jgi:hypothetical protein
VIAGNAASPRAQKLVDEQVDKVSLLALEKKLGETLERRIVEMISATLAHDSGYVRTLKERVYAELHDGMVLERERRG